jgi:hypothetical protein
MRTSRWMLLFAVLAVMPLAGCGDNGNSACEPCNNVDDCESGLSCQQFTDVNTGAVRNLCGDANPNMTCPR